MADRNYAENFKNINNALKTALNNLIKDNANKSLIDFNNCFEFVKKEAGQFKNEITELSNVGLNPENQAIVNTAIAELKGNIDSFLKSDVFVKINPDKKLSVLNVLKGEFEDELDLSNEFTNLKSQLDSQKSVDEIKKILGDGEESGLIYSLDTDISNFINILKKLAENKEVS